MQPYYTRRRSAAAGTGGGRRRGQVSFQALRQRPYNRLYSGRRLVDSLRRSNVFRVHRVGPLCEPWDEPDFSRPFGGSGVL